jgi:hypothetical protein
MVALPSVRVSLARTTPAHEHQLRRISHSFSLRHYPAQFFHPLTPFQTLNMFFYSPVSLVCCLLLVQPGFAHPARSCQAAPVAGRAAYIITNEETNMVISLAVDENGMLSAGSKVTTGGAGAVSIDGSTNQPAGADPLVSQSSLTVVGNVST